MTAWVLAPPGPANLPVGSMPGFQPMMVPSSVANRNTAGADVVCPAWLGPLIWKVLPPTLLRTVPVGAPPVRLTGVGMFTTSGLIETVVGVAAGTLKSVDTPALLSEVQKGPPSPCEIPHGLTRLGSRT